MGLKVELANTCRSIERTEAFPLLKTAIKNGDLEGINKAISKFMQENRELCKQIQELLLISNLQEEDGYQVGETISENPLAILLACYVAGWEEVEVLFKDRDMLRLSLKAHGMNALGMKVYYNMKSACNPPVWAEAPSSYDPEEDAYWTCE